MTTGPWRRRRVERLAQLLDEASGGRRQRVRSPHDDELAEFVAIRNQLAETPQPEVDPDFRAGLRTMLVAAAEREGVRAGGVPESPAPEPARRPAQGPRARTALITGVTIGAVAFAGMSTASANAVPGDALYGVKRSTERAQLALAGSDVGRAQLYLDFARTRLTEASTLTDGLHRVLDDMDRDTTAGVSLLTTAAANRHDPAALDPISPFVTDQSHALDDLADRVSGTDQERVEESLGLLQEITERATALRQHLANGCQSAASIIDEFGPNPQTCVTLPPPGALGPPQPGGPMSQQAESSDSLPPHNGEDRAPATPDGSADASSDSDSDSGSEPALPSDSAEQPSPPPADDGSQDGGEDGGLLDDLDRLLGDLLGG